jgi:RHS repeat-associated protein
MTFGNNKVTNLACDDRARAQTIASSGVLGLVYGYDGVDNVTSFDNTTVPGSSRTMGYDNLNRLISSIAPSLWGTAVYDYDELGNRNLKSVGSATINYAYDPLTNRLASATGPEPALVAMTFSWDLPGRLASASDGTSYRYDALGRRALKADSTQTTVYHYDGSNRLLAETLPADGKLREYIYLGNLLIAVDGCIAAQPPGCSERQWYHTDVLGSALARTDTAGNVVARFEYQAWGERHAQSGIEGDRQYNGRVYDPGTGFHDYGARMYWPQIGRFISPDTNPAHIKDPQSLNRYAYVFNNPYKYVDPTGRDGVSATNWALRQVGNYGYAFWRTHGYMGGFTGRVLNGVGAPKCNAFVFDALEAGGNPVPLMTNSVMPTARDWADSEVNISGYIVLGPDEKWQVGDVLSDGHHMGIFAPLADGTPATISAATDRDTFTFNVVWNDWGTRKDQKPITARRFITDLQRKRPEAPPSSAVGVAPQPAGAKEEL